MKGLTANYALIQGTYWMGVAGILGFASPYLLDRGFANGQIGLLIAAAGVATACLQPALAGWADDPKSPSLWHMTLALGGGSCLWAAVLLVCRGAVFTGAACLGAILLLQTLQPLVNALGVDRSIHFGLARGSGSVAYALVAYGLGRAVGRFGSGAIPLATLGTGKRAVAFLRELR